MPKAVTFGKRDISRINNIVNSMNGNNLVEIKYTDKKGNFSKRVVEPYKIDNNDFWGYDNNKSSIRRFKVKNISGIKVLKNTYVPRWDIEMTNLPILGQSIEKTASMIDFLYDTYK